MIPLPSLLRVLGCLGLTMPLAFAAPVPRGTVSLVWSAVEQPFGVEYRAVDEPTNQLARVGQVMTTGDRLYTRRNARAEVRLHPNGADLSLAPFSSLTFVESESWLSLLQGRFRYLSGRGPAPIGVSAPGGYVIGSGLGTEYEVRVETNRTVIAVIDGGFAYTNRFVEGGRSRTEAKRLAAGEEATFYPDAPPEIRPIPVKGRIQWWLYYPAVLDVDDLPLDAKERERLGPSLEAYRRGNYRTALAEAGSWEAPSDGELLYRAALDVVAGETGGARARLKEVWKGDRNSTNAASVSEALELLIATVGAEERVANESPRTASEWVALSYHRQSHRQLTEAREAAAAAVALRPRFGPAWLRLGELAFGFGERREAADALARARQYNPDNPQVHVLAGFVAAANNDLTSATEAFETAIDLDPRLANGFLGRGLVRIRLGGAENRELGLADLERAAALEPNRALLRAYLGRGYQMAALGWRSSSEFERLAAHEYGRARQLDPEDPTAYLFEALFDQSRNRINPAIRQLERSLELNETRALYRSRQMLEQDRAMRGVNLAGLYRDAGMTEVSLYEASRAVNSDYGNPAAHLFLANSYNTLRDTAQVNLRYESPWLNELLLANLLAPVGAGSLSTFVSEQEYSTLFEPKGLGALSATRFDSRGQWYQGVSQYGTLDRLSYSLDGLYRGGDFDERSRRPNSDYEDFTFWAKAKFELRPDDELLVQVQSLKAESGDPAQYYDPAQASRTQKVEEEQLPNLWAGYHHRWGVDAHTLVLVGRLVDSFELEDSRAGAWLVTERENGQVRFLRFDPKPHSLNFESDLEAYTVEAQQIQRFDRAGFVAGARYQSGEMTTLGDSYRGHDPSVYPPDPVPSDRGPGRIPVSTELARTAAYAYFHADWIPRTRVTLGVTYDRLDYPRNIEVPPLSDEQRVREGVLPKVGLDVALHRTARLRLAYTQSFGGVFFDQSVRLEPSQVGGFVQTFRSAIPESIVGQVPGSRFETFGAALELRPGPNSFLTLVAEELGSDAERTRGHFEVDPLHPASWIGGSLTETLDYREDTLAATWNQIVGDFLSLGVQYRISVADLETRLLDAAPATQLSREPDIRRNETSTLQTLRLFGIVNHPSGWFGGAEAVWLDQLNRGYDPRVRDIPGEAFWQFNVEAGYRWPGRRAEIRAALLNLTDEDYRLYPLNLHPWLPRERAVSLSFKVQF